MAPRPFLARPKGRTTVINEQARRARARLAAHRHWHGDDTEELDRLTEQFYRELETSRIDEGIDDLVAKAGSMTAEQLARIRRLASAAPQ
jgi:hypothetical protein